MTLVFMFTFIFSLVLVKAFVYFAPRLGVVDIPNFRSSHSKATPNCCGIALLTSVILIALLTDLSIYKNHLYSIFAIFLVCFLGLYDDIKNIRARYKIAVIAIAATLSSLDGIIISTLGTYFGQTISLMWLSIPVTIFMIVGFTNSVNLIDGLDGLAGTIILIMLTSLWYIGYQNNDHLIIGVTSLFIPALLAFLVFNWNPAKVFMGDSGSLTLGFVISILSIKALNYVNPNVILYLLALPIIDTLVIMTRRLKTGHPIFSPDKKHIHHVLLNLYKGKVKTTVLVIALIQLAYTFAGFIIVRLLPQEVALSVFLLSILMWYLILTKLCIKPSILILKSCIVTRQNNIEANHSALN